MWLAQLGSDIRSSVRLTTNGSWDDGTRAFACAVRGAQEVQTSAPSIMTTTTGTGTGNAIRNRNGWKVRAPVRPTMRVTEAQRQSQREGVEAHTRPRTVRRTHTHPGHAMVQNGHIWKLRLKLPYWTTNGFNT